MRKVEVFPYQQTWKADFLKEKEILQRLLQVLHPDVYHIGSTGVPELAAKPVIDILVGVERIEDVDVYEPDFEKEGYIVKGENGIKGRRFFMKGTEENRSHHVHVFQKQNLEIMRHLAFRDFLIAHPSIARSYGELKQKLAAKHPYDIEQYIAEKSPWIKEHEQKAIDWYKGKSQA